MADKPNNNGEIGKIDPNSIGIRRATRDDLQDLYRLLDEFYVNLRIGGEEFCKAYYEHKMQEMVKKNFMILYNPEEIIAAFTLSGKPFMGTKGWEEKEKKEKERRGEEGLETQKAIYLDGVAIKPDMLNRGMEESLFNYIGDGAKSLKKDCSLLRVAAVDWFEDFYKGNGFNPVGKRHFRDIYNYYRDIFNTYTLVLMEKKLK